ncbi:MAG: hypothetical protein PHW33_01415 [Candidatus Portnoybacteria bacterium]|jgi:hypothetical protein|nr:hypothetical protein [Candidatus Portnoybacteria bacterium]
MGEIKKRFNINKITGKNLFLVILLMVAMAVVGIANKLTGSKTIDAVQAQDCWTGGIFSGCAGGCEGSSGASSEASSDCASDCGACEGAGYA